MMKEEMSAIHFSQLATMVIATLPRDMSMVVLRTWQHDKDKLREALREVLIPPEMQPIQMDQLGLFQKLDLEFLDDSCKIPHLSVRSLNLLHNNRIVYVGELVQKKVSELPKGCGRKVRGELSRFLAEMVLSFDMNVQGWIPPDKRNK